jgi:hypothetical protein
VFIPFEPGITCKEVGGAKFVWFKTLVKVDSNRIFTCSVAEKTFPKPTLAASVPGPSRIPTPALPKRPAPQVSAQMRQD